MITHTITPSVYDNSWLKLLDTELGEPTNNNKKKRIINLWELVLQTAQCPLPPWFECLLPSLSRFVSHYKVFMFIHICNTFVRPSARVFVYLDILDLSYQFKLCRMIPITMRSIKES